MRKTTSGLSMLGRQRVAGATGPEPAASDVKGLHEMRHSLKLVQSPYEI